MLVLSRKANESIMIGKDIEIKVLGIEDGKVKIGIDAPRGLEIYRREIYVEIEEENITASKQNLNLENLKILFKK
ncbi:carbon storage regulator CsrA [Alkaliphilus oremlandii]|uniref:Translational regulator CsrA n=1 Tax=Alkaliphilus oremlandii (strain OhILAs) TaxID=350688 RepID=CSRA_ALKOO|nr:carbon storage regulator CsrA [Alkaliphilus oremlandii]A8MJP4.1 RecName: Full=Translational regulator CsrA [Alkaliphilus oremlandii OhILAs]ABW20026.1 carbon storage regulator, CsrA [Alkaliphilus oremlandii OhILAs]